MPISREEFEQRYAERIKSEEDKLFNESKQKYLECKKRKQKEKKKKTIIEIVTLIVCVCISLYVVYNVVIIPNREYRAADILLVNGDEEGAIVAFQELGTYSDADERWKAIRYAQAERLLGECKYEEAIAVFNGILQYRDSSERIEKIRSEYWLDMIRLANVEDYITFGKYKQEDIEWIVLAKENEQVWVVSKHVLDSKPYSSTTGTWETSSLRTWLNNDFFHAAFNEDEKKHIPQVSVIVDEYQVRNDKAIGINTGNVVQDRVFLLGIDDVRYIPFGDERGSRPGDSVHSKYTYEGKINWWLKPVNRDSAAYYSQYGGINNMFGGGTLQNEVLGVRPSLWIDLR